MKTVIGNWETNIVTTIYPTYDTNGYKLTPRQRANAMRRMNAPAGAKFRNVPVSGAKLSDDDVHALNV